MSIERGAAVFWRYIHRWNWIPNSLCLAVWRSCSCPTSDRLHKLQQSLPRLIIIGISHMSRIRRMIRNFKGDRLSWGSQRGIKNGQSSERFVGSFMYCMQWKWPRQKILHESLGARWRGKCMGNYGFLAVCFKRDILSSAA